MKEGLFVKFDRDGVMWIYLLFEGQEILLGYYTKNAMPSQDLILRYIEKQKEVSHAKAVAT